MSQPRYPDYADDPEKFRAAMARWPEAFRQCLAEEERADWIPWFGASLDGNPVFSTRHRVKPRGLSIHLEAQADDPAYLTTIRRTFDERGHNEEPIEYLMILCADSDAVVPRVQEVMRQFVAEGY